MGRRLRRWQRHRRELEAELDRLMQAQRESVRQAVATRIQQEDRRLALTTALEREDAFLAEVWANPERWCDAKAVLSGLRSWLQERRLKLRIDERDLIDAMASVPQDVRKVLAALQRLAKGPAPRTGARDPAETPRRER